jgi:hypothetical protein
MEINEPKVRGKYHFVAENFYASTKPNLFEHC